MPDILPYFSAVWQIMVNVMGWIANSDLPFLLRVVLYIITFVAWFGAAVVAPIAVVGALIAIAFSVTIFVAKLFIFLLLLSVITSVMTANDEKKALMREHPYLQESEARQIVKDRHENRMPPAVEAANERALEAISDEREEREDVEDYLDDLKKKYGSDLNARRAAINFETSRAYLRGDGWHWKPGREIMYQYSKDSAPVVVDPSLRKK